MSQEIIDELEESRRNALVAYYLGQIVPNHEVDAARSLATPEDLYEFLLIDNQVNAKVDTSEVALAIAGVQQYIHMIYNGMEPGHLGIYRKDEQKLWRQWMSEYAVWAGNQMLQDYPENYLDPTLRLNRTTAFDEFINDTNQGRISKQSVQAALHSYLKKFESLCNLDTVSGYIDGLDFKTADYYFVGQQREAPHKYFWRKLKIREGALIRNESTADGRWEHTVPDDSVASTLPQDKASSAQIGISPAAWTEWEAIEIPKGDQIVAIRPFVVNGRLYVAWVEYKREHSAPNDQGLASAIHSYSIHLSYREAGGGWAVPRAFPLKAEREGFTGTSAYPFIATAGLAIPHEPRIILSYGALNNEGEKFILSGAHEVLYPREKTAALEDKIVEALKDYRGSVHTIQYPDTSTNRKIKLKYDPTGDDTVNGLYNNFMTFDVILGYEGAREKAWMYSKISAVHVDSNGDTPNVAVHSIRKFHENGTGIQATNQPLNGNFEFVSEFSDHEVMRTKKYITKIVLPDNSVSAKEYKPEFSTLEKDHIPTIGKTSQGAQYLDLGPLQVDGLTYVRLNTTFGKELVARAEESVDALLDWGTQHMAEPALPGEQPALMDFHGTHGRYFWELFFHIPHAIAWRLHAEFDYVGAQEWLHYIFNPLARIKPTKPASPPYWSVRALMEQSPITYEFEGLTDPDAICYSNPVHYRKAIFMFYVRNLMAYGDQLYRGLTRDSLNEAKLSYVQAMSLLGPKPDNRMVDRWTPCLLGDAAQYVENTFAEFETAAPLGQSYSRAIVNGLPWLSLLDAPWVRLPINTELLTLWDDLQLRMHNLRNNLTLDGKPLQLPLYAPPVNPKDLLQAQSSGNGIVQRGVGSMASVPPYRFRALLPRVQGAVETLMRFGDQVRMYREQKERAVLEELQQSHLLELSEFTISLQQASLEQARLSLTALETSKAGIEKRRDYFAQQASENISNAEQTAMDLYLSSGVLGATASGLQTAAGAANMASVIVTAFGGGHTRAGAAFVAAASATSIASDATRLAGERISITEQYRRRRQDWEYQRDQAEAEIGAINEQLAVQKKAIELAETQLAQAQRAKTQAQAYYTFLKTRTTHSGLYQWLLSQMSTLYFQAYDAVVALCLSLESSWRYEMGDDETRFIQPNVWFDNYHGLTAGETLRLQLLRMEAAYLRRNDRRLELTRTVSLRELMDRQHQLDNAHSDWDATLQAIIDDGKVDFDLPHWLFDSDYPGHYLRQIATISVSLPAVIGPYQDVRAVLTQISSKTVLKADMRAMNYLYDADDKNSMNIRFNPRASQSIGLSRGVDEHGLFTLDFNDERYLPFEGTGAISRWELTFPRHDKLPQKEILETLADIIIQVRYTALDGGPTFAEDVSALLDPLDS
ncbi:neuraminidase-like domain-containing protein [Mycetohabitans rhizoxinica]|uniref:Insecticidal toxin complex protein TccB n=1 Tax=Mycetohabitans rhizoxinica TaxID=412963 RepID=A0ABZ2PUT9_9BURK